MSIDLRNAAVAGTARGPFRSRHGIYGVNSSERVRAASPLLPGMTPLPSDNRRFHGRASHNHGHVF